MKKNLILLMLFILGTLLLSQTVSAGPLDSAGDAFEKVINLGTLNFLGSSDSQVIGFIRILLGILIFTLFYALSGTLGEYISRNIAITISIILAIITSIAMPAGVISAVLVSYGTIMSFLLLGIAIVPLAWFIIFHPTQTRAMAALKLALLGFVSWLIGQVNIHLSNISTGVPSAVGGTWGNFGTWVDQLTNYAYLILFGFGIYLVYKLIAPSVKKAGSVSWGLSKNGAGKAKDFVNGHLEKSMRNMMTKSLREYVLEKDELKLLNSVEDGFDELENYADDILAGAPLKDKPIEKTISIADGVESRIRRALKKFKAIKKRTWRQQRGMEGLLKELKKQNMKTDEIEALESNILKLHDDTKKILDKVATDFPNTITNYIGEKLEELVIEDVKVGMRDPSFPQIRGKPAHQDTLKVVTVALKPFRAELEEAVKKQEEVIKTLDALLLKCRV